MEEIKICETCEWHGNRNAYPHCRECSHCGNGTVNNWEPKQTPKILDSGDRTEYGTGAVRDCKAGKGRCDLMPLDVLASLMGNTEEDDPILRLLDYFKSTGDIDALCHAVGKFCKGMWKPEGGWCNTEISYIPNAMLEVSKHFEAGAEKYGPNNWQKGIPVHSYIDSAVRHYLKYKAGWTDEPHDRAFVWNLMCCIWTMLHHPEMDDFTEGRKNAEE